MTLSSLAERYRPQVARELESLVSFTREHASPWAKDVEARYRGMSMGKAMRGLLTLIGHGAASGRISRDAIRLGATIELMHAALIVHDDVIDQDLVRRGRPSLLAQYLDLSGRSAHPQHLAGSMAFLAGDVALLRASRALANLAAKSAGAERAADAVLGYCTDTGFGEMEDVALGTGLQAVSEGAIVRMLVGKTARYSCSMPLVAGAYLAGGSKALAKKLEALGEDLGVIFQIRDDELGLFGTTEQIGKPAGSDIREGKQTLYALYLREAATPRERRRLAGIYGSPAASEGDFQYVRDLTARHGVDRKVARAVSRRERRAAAAISALRVRTPYADILREVLAYVSRRAH